MGSWLVDELIKRGHQVVSADNLLGGNERNVNRECKFVKADMRIRDRVSEVVKGVDVIFHLAAYAAEGQSFFSPVAINEINIVPMNNFSLKRSITELKASSLPRPWQFMARRNRRSGRTFLESLRTLTELQRPTARPCWRFSHERMDCIIPFYDPTTCMVHDKIPLTHTGTF